jgi:cyclic nucleotide gated channel
MADQERDDIPMLLRNVELPKFPRSTSMCMPMRDEDYEEDTYVPHTGPLSSQPPAQTAAAGAGNLFVGRRTPDRPPRHPQVKPVSKPQAVMPEEAGGNRWSHGGDGPKNEHLMMSGPLGQCDNPDCVNCPPACKNKRFFQRAPHHFDNKVRVS